MDSEAVRVSDLAEPRAEESPELRDPDWPGQILLRPVGVR